MKVSVAGTANRIFLPATSFHCGDYSQACLRRGAAWEMYDAPQALFTGPFVPGYNISGIPGISNIKAYVWWASWSWWYLTDYSAGAPSVGFFAMLDQVRFTQEPPADEMATHQVEHEGVLYDAGVVGESFWVKQSELVFQGTELGDGAGPTLRAVRNDRCDWNYHATYGKVVMPQRHPYNQIALGGETMDLTTHIGRDWSGAPAPYPMLKARPYRTPLKLLKKSKDFYLDDSLTFEQVPTRFTPESLGAVITIGRTGAYGLLGDLPFATLAPDSSINVESIMFYGLELEFV